MRIIDWSSYVVSSDLSSLACPLEERHSARRRQAEPVEAHRLGRVGYLGGEGAVLRRAGLAAVVHADDRVRREQRPDRAQFSDAQLEQAVQPGEPDREPAQPEGSGKETGRERVVQDG